MYVWQQKDFKFAFKRLDMSNFIFRDTGIVIQISILQWVVEVFQISVYLFYMFNYRGKSHELDKFFSLYMLAFTIIVIPLFYLNGDLKFRTDLANSGYITALKNALKWIKDKPMKTSHLHIRPVLNRITSASTCLTSCLNSLQLNKYETAPKFIQAIQNLTSDCLLI